MRCLVQGKRGYAIGCGCIRDCQDLACSDAVFMYLVMHCTSDLCFSEKSCLMWKGRAMLN